RGPWERERGQRDRAGARSRSGTGHSRGRSETDLREVRSFDRGGGREGRDRPRALHRTLDRGGARWFARGGLGTRPRLGVHARASGNPRLVPLAAIHPGFWPAITLRQSPPSPLARLTSLAAVECGLWLGARDPEARRHHWKGH